MPKSGSADDTVERLVRTLQTVTLFAALPREVVARLASSMEELHVAAGEMVFARSDAADAMYVVVDGTLEATIADQGEEVTVAVVGPGDWVGEMALITGDPRSATIVALSDSVLVRLAKDRFALLCERYPIFLREVTRTVCRRLVRASESFAHARRVYERLFDSVLSTCDDETRRVLGHLVLAVEARPEILGGLPGCASADERLRGLARAHPVLLATRDDGSYELHAGFRKHLHAQLLGALGADEVTAIHAAFAAACEKHDHAESALRHWLDAGEWSRAAALVKRMLASSAPPADETLGAWLERIPLPALVDADLLDARVAWLRRQGRGDEIVPLYRQVLSLVPRQSGRLGTLVTALADEHVRRGETDLALACLAEWGTGHAPRPAAYARPVRASQGEVTFDLRAARALVDALRELRAPFVQRLGLVHGAPGLLLAFGAAALVLLLPPAGLSQPGVRFLAVLVAGTVLWIRGRPPDYVVALGMGAAWVLLGVAPPQVAFSGFAGSTWFLLLGVLGLSAALSRSGLLYRITLAIVRGFPATFPGQTVALAVAGTVGTLFVPLITPRVALMAPVALGLSDSLGYPARSRGSTGLALAAFTGVCLTTTLFLTGTATCLTAWRILPDAARAEITWGRWLAGALVVESVTLAGALAWIVWRYRPRDARPVPASLVDAQLRLLGPWSRQEIITAALAAALLLGWAAQPWHGVDPAWLSVGALIVLISTRVLDRNAVQTQIDWPLLIFLGMVFSLSDLGVHVGASTWLANLTARWTGVLHQPLAVVVASVLFTMLARFLLPWQPAVPLIVVSLVPLMQHAGLHPWIAALVALKAGNVFLMPSQNTFYLSFYYGTEERAFTHESARAFAWVYAGLVLAGFLLSLPYWYALGLAR